MTFFGALFAVTTLVAAPADVMIAGDYVEFRTADVFTGPCFANAEIGLTGAEAAMIWRVRDGSWNGVDLTGLVVVAVVRGTNTLGDPYSVQGAVKSAVIVDDRATPAQRAALVEFARSQNPALLANIIAVKSLPIRFEQSGHGYVSVAVGEGSPEVAVSTRPFHEGDHICFNETAFYPPLAGNLTHTMPVMTANAQYQGEHLGITWRDKNRRGSYVGNFEVLPAVHAD
jgi:hypothetical protein